MVSMCLDLLARLALRTAAMRRAGTRRCAGTRARERPVHFQIVQIDLDAARGIHALKHGQIGKSFHRRRLPYTRRPYAPRGARTVARARNPLHYAAMNTPQRLLV